MDDVVMSDADSAVSRRSRLRPTFYGAAAGGLLALMLMAFFGGRAALGSVEAVLLDPTGQRARPEFVVSSGGLYLLLVILGIIGGLAVAAIVYAFGREAEPTAKRFGLKWLFPVAGVTGAIFVYAVGRAGLGALADIEAGVVTVSVFRMTLIAALAGAVAGGITANVIDALARPDTLGLEGEAIPESTGAFVAEMMRAVGGPMMALIVLAIFAISLSQILLSFHSTVGSVAVFSIVGAIVLGLASLAAYRPWERDGSNR